MEQKKKKITFKDAIAMICPGYTNLFYRLFHLQIV